MNNEKFRVGKVSGLLISGLLISIVLIGAGLVYLAQSNSVSGASFGFEKNIDVRKSADAESVAGCMRSCEDMLAGWLAMNPDSKNYTRQGEKIKAKAQQCLGMNTLAGFPFTKEQILLSCGLVEPTCREIPRGTSINDGACANIPFIGELLNLPQCCTVEKPSVDCGVNAEWVVGVAAFPVCYIPGS